MTKTINGLFTRLDLSKRDPVNTQYVEPSSRDVNESYEYLEVLRCEFYNKENVFLLYFLVKKFWMPFFFGGPACADSAEDDRFPLLLPPLL
jgi:hypothetical protein